MNNTSKRERLTTIVSKLGPEATPASIREEAYRQGFGVVNGEMLRVVRDSLWPDRKRHGGGYSREQRLDGLKRELVPCPKCGSARVWAKSRYRHRNRSGMCTRKRLCRDCGNAWNRLERDEPLPGKQTSLIQWAILKERECTYCKRTLPVEAFSLQSGSDVIRRPGCKECLAKYRSEKQFRDSLKQHGLTPEQYEGMLSKQDGRCAICRTDKPFGPVDYEGRKRKRRMFSIDHCHATGKVRGLLCARCNIAIGNFSDSIDLFRAAIAYIESQEL